MAQSEIQQTLLLAEPNLADLLNLFKKDILLNLNCHHIGTIESYDANKQTAKATINYQKTFFVAQEDGTYVPTLKSYPIIQDCPVISLGGGNGCLTFPIAQGDECLVLFNDRDIDNWFAGGGSGGALATPRLHSFADGIILVGVRSLANVIKPPPATDAIELRTKDGNARVSVSADGTKITAKLGPDGPTQVSLVLTETGKLMITNPTGEFVQALYTALTTATAGGFPLIVNPTALATLLSFQGP